MLGLRLSLFEGKTLAKDCLVATQVSRRYVRATQYGKTGLSVP